MLAVSAILLCSARPALAVDGISGELGYRDDVRLWRAGLQWKWQRRWLRGGDWELGGYWDLSAGGWRNGRDTIYDLGFTPVFRLERTTPGSAYLEAAIGFHLLSDLRINDDRVFSTSFQFGDHIGIGRRFGPRDRYDLSVRLQHLSNGGIRKPNPGIDFVQLRFQYHLRK
ncbi:MAG: acyloxyacyl hydrolase [Betaproteobacteria bacterium]